MKVKDLIEWLEKQDPESIVHVENNDVRVLYRLMQGVIYYNHVYFCDWSAHDAGVTEAEWQAMLKLPRIVILAS